MSFKPWRNKAHRLFWALEYQNGPVVFTLFLGLFNIGWWSYAPWRTLSVSWNLD